MQLTLDYQNMDASYKGKAKGNRKCLEQFEKFKVGTWAKKYANLLISQEGWYSMTCDLTWKLRSTKSHRFYFHLFPSYQHTELLPTPMVSYGSVAKEEQIDGMNKIKNGKRVQGLQLQDLAFHKMLPTPRAQEPGRTSEGYGASLTDIVMGYKMLPTPRSRDYKGDRKLKNGKNITSNGEEMALTLEQVARIMTSGLLPTPAAVDWKQTTLAESQRNRSTLPGLMVKTFLPMPDKMTDSQKNSQLSPQFVMEMMGFPTDWTLLPFSKK
jgi:hypothetical protein